MPKQQNAPTCSNLHVEVQTCPKKKKYVVYSDIVRQASVAAELIWLLFTKWTIGGWGVRSREILMVPVCVILSLGIILWLVLRGRGVPLGLVPDFVLQFWDLFASVVPLKMRHVFLMCSWVIWSVLVRPGCDLMWLLASCLFALVQLFTGAVVPGTFVFPVFCGGFKGGQSVLECEVVWSGVK